ncbi:MAG: VCBS repeat-containing protein [Planctomycetota bacterium]|nr:VCBS repeat-containing protein [Planctomycetota bacterium]MDA1210869.1 VCBS repeat-containing protein [Planctomycetota bacterium]
MMFLYELTSRIRWAVVVLALAAGPVLSQEKPVSGVPSPGEDAPKKVVAGPLTFTEHQVLHDYTYAYGIATADFDGDGDLDITSADAEPNSNLYLLLNDGKGTFTHSFIQKYNNEENQPIRLERHDIGDIDRDGDLDVVIVDNLKWDIRWYANPGNDHITELWTLNRVAEEKEVPGSYDVALTDIDDDGDLDVAASSWRFGNRFDWFENVGSPGNGSEWKRHEIDAEIGETRTIAVVDFNRDGKPDLLGTSRTGHHVMWYANPKNPKTDTWKKTAIDDNTLYPAHGHPVDIDKDGDLDVVMAFGIAGGASPEGVESHQIAWYENIGTPGRGTEWIKHDVVHHFPHGFEAVAGDLDDDGDIDIVGTGWSPDGRIAWFENSGDPTGEWAMHMLKTPWTNAVTVILADFDGDKRLDIAACAERTDNELRWWRNEGPTKK